MKIYISCDAEGIGSIAEWEQCCKGEIDYNMGRNLMVGEVNAAIEGALSAGAKEIVVCDSHERMINLIPEKLNPKAFLVQGTARSMSMIMGLDSSFDAAMFIGYHSMAGTPQGTLSHTYTSILMDVIINGTPVGEPELNAMLAGWYGVPLIFLAGDEAATKEIKRFVPKIVTVATKKALGRRASMSRHPEENRKRITKGVQTAIGRIKQIKPLKAKSPVKLGLNFFSVEMADCCEVIPGVERTGSRSVVYKNRNFKEIYGMFLTIMRVAAGVK